MNYEITDYHIKIIEAKLCPYCKSETEVITETEVYGKEYSGRNIIACKNFPQCDSYVGSHRDGTPLGRLANKELRFMKGKAHFWFDKIWENKLMERGKLYGSLSDFLELPREYTHIGMFSISTCLKVESWSKEQYYKLKAQ